MHLRSSALAAALCVLAGAAPAAAADPPLTVPKAKLDAALHCHGKLQGAKREPIMLVTGTGATGDEAYAIGKGAFDAFAHPVCTVNFPDFTTADIQVSVQYLVSGIRTMERRAGRPIAIFGISQGGLLPRWALTYWPSLRAKVTDVLAAAGTQHGTTLGDPAACAASGCPPAVWQQLAGSKLLAAINAQPDETPGPTAWTTVRSAGDETVQPQTGPHPTSALKGATNVLIQSVCPGRMVSHIGTALDSVTFAAFADALAHKGAARIARLPQDVCVHPYAPGLDEAGTTAVLGASGNLITARLVNQVPRVAAEPPVRAYARRPNGRGGIRVSAVGLPAMSDAPGSPGDAVALTLVTMTTGERYEVDGSAESIEAAIVGASRGSIMQLAWLTEAGTGRAIAINPLHVVALAAAPRPTATG